MVGVVIGRMGMHGNFHRGYIGMLVVASDCRGQGIGITHTWLCDMLLGSSLVRQLVEIMIKEGAQEVSMQLLRILTSPRSY